MRNLAFHFNTRILLVNCKKLLLLETDNAIKHVLIWLYFSSDGHNVIFSLLLEI